MLKHISRLAVLSALVATAGCDSILSPSERDLRQVGILRYQNEPVDVTIPLTAVSGVPFDVRVRTYGTGCHHKGDIIVGAVEGGTRIEPYDYLRVNDNTCTTQLQTFEHVASVTLSTPGAATIIVTGVAEPSRDMVRLERTVQVSAN